MWLPLQFIDLTSLSQSRLSSNLRVESQNKMLALTVSANQENTFVQN